MARGAQLSEVAARVVVASVSAKVAEEEAKARTEQRQVIPRLGNIEIYINSKYT